MYLCHIVNPPAISLALIPFLVWYFAALQHFWFNESDFFVMRIYSIVIVWFFFCSSIMNFTDHTVVLFRVRLCLSIYFLLVISCFLFARYNSVAFLCVLVLAAHNKCYRKFLFCFEVSNRVECRTVFTLSLTKL